MTVNSNGLQIVIFKADINMMDIWKLFKIKIKIHNHDFFHAIFSFLAFFSITVFFSLQNCEQ